MSNRVHDLFIFDAVGYILVNKSINHMSRAAVITLVETMVVRKAMKLP